MIRPSRHDYTDDNYAGIRIANYVALGAFAVALLVATKWFYSTFLDAVPAISRIVGGK